MMIKGELRLAVPNPHGSRDIDDALLGRILRQASVSRDQFEFVRRKR
jgi:hypothetical protein